MNGDRILLTGLVLLGIGGILVYFSGQRELQRRWATWVGASLIIVAAATLPGGIQMLALALAGVAAAEYALLVDTTITGRVLIIVAVLAPVCVAAGVSTAQPARTVVLLIAAPIAPLMFRNTANRASALARLVCGIGLIGLPLAALAVIPTALAIPAIVAVSIADVAAWAGGRTLGRRGWWHRPISRWSPNKTRGGALCALLAGGLSLCWFGPWWLAPLVPISGVWGDLRESRLKRAVGVKDAGTWLPGFGGLLDRVDSVLGAALGVGMSVLIGIAVALPAAGAAGTWGA